MCRPVHAQKETLFIGSVRFFEQYPFIQPVQNETHPTNSLVVIGFVSRSQRPFTQVQTCYLSRFVPTRYGIISPLIRLISSHHFSSPRTKPVNQFDLIMIVSILSKNGALSICVLSGCNSENGAAVLSRFRKIEKIRCSFHQVRRSHTDSSDFCFPVRKRVHNMAQFARRKSLIF